MATVGFKGLMFYQDNSCN